MKNKVTTVIILGVIICLLQAIAYSQKYFVCTYGNCTDQEIGNVFIKSIDLSTKTITDSLLVASRGCIWKKKPAQIMLNGQQFLVCLAENGGYNKNSDIGPYSIYYAVMIGADNLVLVKKDSISNAKIEYFDQYSEEQYFVFGIGSTLNSTPIYPKGIYTINNDGNFRHIGVFNPLLPPGVTRHSDNFNYLHRLNLPNNNRLYRSIGEDSRFWILHLNGNQNIIDSLMIESNQRASDIYAYHPQRNKLYIFHVNYENQGKFDDTQKNYAQDWITPEVLIYDPSTFHLLERHEIADFDSANYPGNERGMADVVGDYIVYYFFEDDWMENFYPAMLFIFDTRTNQATWLRVGWR